MERDGWSDVWLLGIRLLKAVTGHAMIGKDQHTFFSTHAIEVLPDGGIGGCECFKGAAVECDC